MESAKVLFLLYLFGYTKPAMSTSDDYAILSPSRSNLTIANTRFILFTRNDQSVPERLQKGDDAALALSLYDISKATKFIANGYLNPYQGENCITVKNAFLAHGDYNVIVVDYSSTAKLGYPEAASFSKAVGAYIAEMIDFLASQGSSTNDMTLVGHSLGAHVMGLAGYQASNKVGHVVGLDPARPGFENAGPGEGISTSDATLVEVIHTDGGDLGLAEPIGHADYYPNGGGPEQPGCGEDLNHYCAHDRAYMYYAEALIKPNSLLAVRCKDDDTFLKGECINEKTVPFPASSGIDKKARGSYYLRTADSEPFGLGIEGTRPAVSKTNDEEFMITEN